MSIRAEAVPKLARRTLALFVFFLLAVITGMGRGSAGSEDSGRGYACLVEKVSGVVWWRQPRSSGDTTCRRLEAGMMLRPGCRIKTGKTSRALLTLVDGTTVSIGHDTYLIIGPAGLESVESTSADLAVPQLRMLIGRIWLEVTKRFQLGWGFEVETPSSTVAVRGTAFDVEVDEEGTTYVWVDSGEVVVENEGGSLVVEPGKSGKAKKGLPPEAAEPARERQTQRPEWAGQPGKPPHAGQPGGPNGPHPNDDWPPGKGVGNKKPGQMPPGLKKKEENKPKEPDGGGGSSSRWKEPEKV
ncbi:MAG: FecR family protein [Firmicutes bacterium]|nr:FecR family protein [Bacillota bacterium]MDD4336156.1 FecR family protein [Bacillota bacterium]MDD4791997.1 FecR family protein [Bacillota bacterium]